MLVTQINLSNRLGFKVMRPTTGPAASVFDFSANETAE